MKVSSNIINSCYVGTVYALFLYLSIKSEKEIEQTFFIFNDSIPLVVQRQYKNKRVLYRKRYPLLSLFYSLYLQLLFHTKYSFIYKVPMYGQDHLPYAGLFLSRVKFYLLEDGVGTYEEPQNMIKSEIKEWIRKHLFGININEIYTRKYVEKVILTGMIEIPKYIKKKAVVINLKECFCQRNQNFILQKLAMPNDWNKYICSCDVLLITQNISECGFVTEDEKISIYKKILVNYEGKTVIIKPHPIEKTNYCSFFKDVPILPNYIPIQLLLYLGLCPTIVATITSSSVFEFKNISQIDWYGNKAMEKACVKLDFLKPDDFVNSNV